MEAQSATRAELRHLIPPFSLESTKGIRISPWDYKGKKALIIVFFDSRIIEHLEILVTIGARYKELADANAEVLSVAANSLVELRACADGLDAPFPILSDETGEVSAAYGAEGITLFAADRFGELRMISCLIGDADSVLDNAITVIELTELECPECGAPTWTV